MLTFWRRCVHPLFLLGVMLTFFSPFLTDHVVSYPLFLLGGMLTFSDTLLSYGADHVVSPVVEQIVSVFGEVFEQCILATVVVLIVLSCPRHLRADVKTGDESSSYKWLDVSPTQGKGSPGKTRRRRERQRQQLRLQIREVFCVCASTST